jgi:RNA polymerase sigma factor (sigma-70 family)
MTTAFTGLVYAGVSVTKEAAALEPSCPVMGRPAAGADLEEIEAIYRRRLTELQRLATAITGSREAGCDAVQDAFARAVHRRAEFRREGSLEGWLWRIVVTTARDAARRLAPTRTLRVEHDVEAGSQTDDLDEVRRVVARLPERQRLALFLRYYADLDYGTIADVLGISGGTVGATLNQARENLRRLLTEVPR